MFNHVTADGYFAGPDGNLDWVMSDEESDKESVRQFPWNNTRVVREFDHRAIADLKRQPGKHIMIFGSASIVAKLTEHQLIDEYRFLVSPVILGKGRKLLDDAAAKLKLNSLEASPHRSGHVMLKYAAAA